MKLSKKQVKLLIFIMRLNFRQRSKITTDMNLWEEMGIVSVNDFVDYLNFESYRQLDLFESEITNEEMEHLDNQANEFEYYRNF